MTNLELKKLIANSPQSTLYLEREFTFSFPYIDYSKTLKGLSATYIYVNQQLKGWGSFEDVPTQFNNSITYFTLVRNSIIQFAVNYLHQDIPNIEPYIASVSHPIEDVRNKPFPYELPEVDFLRNVNDKTPDCFQAAYSVIADEVNYPINNSKCSLIGIMMAYEFLQKDSTIIERRKSEKQSLNQIRKEFGNYLSEIEEQTANQINHADKQYSEQVESIEAIKTERIASVDEWFTSSKTDFDTLYTASNANIKALEDTYEELMRLKKPADYWKERATELKNEGDNFFKWLIGLVGFAVLTLYLLLWLTPEGMQKTFFNDDKSLAIRWSVIYITFISFLFFAIKAVMKSMFSSYHLSRDAEERQRLTYVYLAMIKDSSIEKEDRHLVMQSLFSRADTGLLKEDSSPSMPGTGGIFDVVKKN